ncbi:type II toxin-antitoxin system RelE/ParE family toxin [Sphingomonas sp. MAH-20]|uniref:Type II toxin-antitoxin system RelE/ParE family toxin n=1 Tax=Sphingomonas horti TaxID=2682842 RepID=A0A6I4J1H8_9SPHN|nr:MULTISPECIES: type II toxin-antitoxin system RelE/ParE family toxin [Sphingomonas]MBA2919316.1 type II toxin-antitoxin system RelE/ParE family toxin [Sphingomonas sp. CGMCC 1.13658]MVO78197.1 type II toxin-antitoxin system RelE/ParE family toxin [Sphingomonas horti]
MIKRYEVVLDAEAEAQLEDLFMYIAQDASIEVAERFTDAIVEQCEALSHFPNRGTPRDDIQPGLRTIAFRRAVTIAYAVDEDRVEVLGIFYRGRDYESLLN